MSSMGVAGGVGELVGSSRASNAASTARSRSSPSGRQRSATYLRSASSGAASDIAWWRVHTACWSPPSRSCSARSAVTSRGFLAGRRSTMARESGRSAARCNHSSVCSWSASSHSARARVSCALAFGESTRLRGVARHRIGCSCSGPCAWPRRPWWTPASEDPRTKRRREQGSSARCPGLVRDLASVAVDGGPAHDRRGAGDVVDELVKSADGSTSKASMSSPSSVSVRTVSLSFVMSKGREVLKGAALRDGRRS